jgi:uncharacterized protein
MPETGAPSTYLLIDGENIDATLGGILARRPQPEERPRWGRVLEVVGEHWQAPVRGLFFLAVTDELPTAFVQAILAMDYRPVPVQGAGKVVDIAIQRTLVALREKEADVVLASHDGDFEPQLLDLEYDVGSFNTRLPRVRIIPIDEFDPYEFI